VPEGHTIHKLARDHAKLFAGQALRVSSPQGASGSPVRAAVPALAAAEALDGQVLRHIDAHGKHLLYRFEDGTLHVHLGLFGRFRTRRAPIPPARETCRLRLATDEVAADLAGAVASRLLDGDAEDELLARLGPDPLRDDADPEAFWAALRRRRIPLAAALMDQSVVAGVGNVFRAEALHACRLDPYLPARELSREDFEALWATIGEQLRDGVRSGRIVTAPARPGVPRSRLRRGERTVVYRRRSCGTCGGPVRREALAGRDLHWCPACQSTTASQAQPAAMKPR
jgi:formamidopyrimidine-DNA glycosylase